MTKTAAHPGRLFVLGLDGLSLDMARTLGSTLPNIGELAARPGTSTIQAELPELSPVNWTSFYTALGPEDHGVFGFSRVDPATGGLFISDFSQVAAPTIFDRLGDGGFTSRSLNLPNTYPARPIRGMLVSGFVAPDLDRACHPPFLAHRLRDMGYRLEADTDRGKDDPAFLLEDLARTLDSRIKALDLLWQGLSWDLFVFVLTETDRLFHFLFHAVADVAHPLHPGCMEFLSLWDRALGRCLEMFDELPDPKRLIVMADHGFGPVLTEFDLNVWLAERGLITLPENPRSEMDGAEAILGSRAFALDPGRIYLRTESRFPDGSLSLLESQTLLADLERELAAVTFQGRPILEGVHRREDLYPGPMVERAPDLVCVPAPGFDLKAKFDRSEPFGLHARTGTHRPEGAIFHDSRGGVPKRTRDVGRLVLEHFGQTVQA